MIDENREKYAYKSDLLSVSQLYDFVKRKMEVDLMAPTSRHTVSDGSRFVFETPKENAEPTVDSTTSKKASDKLSISSASNISILQNSNLSTSKVKKDEVVMEGNTKIALPKPLTRLSRGPEPREYRNGVTQQPRPAL